jgi:N-acetylmuramoyl-L-alanine amidase
MGKSHRMHATPRKYLFSAAAICGIAAAATLPAVAGRSAQTGELPVLTYDASATEATSLLDSLPPQADEAPAIAAQSTPGAQPAVVHAEQVAHDPAALECMAKVVHHESKNQPRRGQLAVAQAMINRLNDGRFGESICAVAKQRGQFFDLAGYHPRRDTAEWDTAVNVAREALGDTDEQVAPGALFFRASYVPANTFFRGRQRVTQVGAHVFYR